jgi:hypothetical protein
VKTRVSHCPQGGRHIRKLQHVIMQAQPAGQSALVSQPGLLLQLKTSS